MEVACTLVIFMQGGTVVYRVCGDSIVPKFVARTVAHKCEKCQTIIHVSKLIVSYIFRTLSKKLEQIRMHIVFGGGGGSPGLIKCLRESM